VASPVPLLGGVREQASTAASVQRMLREVLAWQLEVRLST
jgi:hypothetical protein